MKSPITLALLIPVFTVSIYLFGNHGAIPFIVIILTILFTEIRWKKGSLSWKNIISFFNTPIRHGGLFGEELVDTSPRVSMFTSIGIILTGALAVTIVIFIGFAFLTR